MSDEITLQSQYRLMEALVAAEHTARMRLDSLHEIVFETDEEGRLSFLNQTWKKALGREPRAALGEPFAAYLAPEDVALWDELRRTAAPGGEYSPLREVRLQHADQAWVVADLTVSRKEDGGWIGALQDASTRKEAEAEIRQLALVAEYTDNGVVITDAQRKVVWVNAGFTRITGYRLEDIRGRDPGAVLQGADTDPATIRTMHEQLARQQAFRVEVLNYRKSGEQVWLALEIQPIHDSNGVLTGFVGLESDITAAKARERRLFQSEAKSRALLAAIPDLMFELSPTGVFESYNAAVLEQLGVPPDAFLGKTLEEVVSPEIARRVRAAIAGLGPERTVETLEYEFALPPRELHQYEARVTRSEAGSYVILARDITARKRMEEALRESETRFRGISASAQDAIVMIGPQGEISFWNRAAEELFGYTSGEVMGRELHRLVMPARFWDRFWQGFTTFQETGIGSAFGKCLPLTAVRRNGDEFPVELSISPLRLGEQWHAVGIVRDVSDRKRVEDELRRAKENAEAANKTKSEFLAIMSHEIRTPINGVLGMLELTFDTLLSDEQRELLSMAQSCAESLRAIIDDILDFSKIEAGRFELQPVPFSLRQVVARALQLLSLRARDKGLQLLIPEFQGLPEVLVGDPARLQQVLVNLVNNAVKFTDQGTIRVQVAVESQTAQGTRLHFMIADTGIGIPEAKCRLIFEPFEQADPTTTRRHGGTGLGLAICARLVTMMGGQIWAESQLGVGSVFHFLVPFAHAPPAMGYGPGAESGTSPGSAAREPLSGSVSSLATVPRRALHVLLAEDEDVSRDLAARMLRKRGHSVTLATNGRDALHAWQATPDGYDVLLTDVMMPGMSGLELSRAIRHQESGTGRRLPIVAMTANAMKGDDATCLAAGMDRYVAKPIARGDLLRVVEECGGQAEDTRPGPAACPASAVASQDATRDGRLDRAGLLEVCGHDRAFVAEIIGVFQEVCREVLPQLRAAAARGDAAELVRHAHRLKGSAGNLRARALQQVLETLEQEARRGVLTNLADRLQQLDVETAAVQPILDELQSEPAT